MAIQNIGLNDIVDRIILSSANTNETSSIDRKNGIFNTASYFLFSINKPAFAIEIANKIDPLESSPSRDSQPLST
jgi:hypothetical protein